MRRKSARRHPHHSPRETWRLGNQPEEARLVELCQFASRESARHWSPGRAAPLMIQPAPLAAYFRLPLRIV